MALEAQQSPIGEGTWVLRKPKILECHGSQEHLLQLLVSQRRNPRPREGRGLAWNHTAVQLEADPGLLTSSHTGGSRGGQVQW